MEILCLAAYPPALCPCATLDGADGQGARKPQHEEKRLNVALLVSGERAAGDEEEYDDTQKQSTNHPYPPAQSIDQEGVSESRKNLLMCLLFYNTVGLKNKWRFVCIFAFVLVLLVLNDFWDSAMFSYFFFKRKLVESTGKIKK